MNLLLNKSLRIVAKSYRIIMPRLKFQFSSTEIDLIALKEIFRKQQDMVIFNDLI